MMSVRTTFALVLLLFAAGCHTYRPGTVSELSAGDRVRTLLTVDQHEELEEYLLGGDRLVEGTVVEATPAELLLEVPILTVAEGIRVESYSQRLRIPLAGVADVEMRLLDWKRSSALAGIIGAAAGAIIWDQVRRRSRRGTTTPTGPLEGPIVIQIPFTAR
jgi:hypothetical protein